MNKEVDFGNDLAALNDNVNAAVGDVLQALQQKRTPQQPAAKAEEQPTEAGKETPASPAEPPPASAPRRQRNSSRTRLTPTIERDEPLENVTTRLRQKTNELLTEAGLRQRLKKESPSTRQDIIEAALDDWFRRHGYARGRDEEIAD